MKYKKLILIALLIGSALYAYKVVYKVSGNDFNVFYLSWELFVTGNAEHLYDDQGQLGIRAGGVLPEGLKGIEYTRAGPFLYPVSFAMTFAPLALIPHDLAEFVWYYLNILSLFLVFLIIIKKLKNIPWHYSLVLFLITGRFLFRSIEYGQVNILILSGVFFCFYFYFEDKKNLSALMLALVTSWKIAPVIIIVYFVWKKDYKFVTRFFAILSALLLAPALFYGFKLNSQLMVALFKQLSVFGFQTDSTNQSIAAMFTRFFTDIIVKVHSQGQPINVMFFELSRTSISYLILALQFVVLIMVYLSVKRNKPKTFESVVLFDGGMMCLLMLLFSHLMWRATLVHLLIPNGALLYFVYTKKMTKPFIALFGASIFLNTLTAQGFMGARLSDWFEAYSCMTIGTLIILFLLFWYSIKSLKTKTASNGIDFISIDNIELTNNVFTSDIIETDYPMDLAVLSWNLSIYDDSLITFMLRAKHDKWTEWYTMGEWGQQSLRRSVKDQNLETGKVDEDTLLLKIPAQEWQLKVLYKKGSTNKVPLLHSVSIAFKNTMHYKKEPGTAFAKQLSVPSFSQFADTKDKELGKIICSPTSVAMVSKYYGVPVEDISKVAELVYDNSANIYGNWSFNVAVFFDLINSIKKGYKTFVRFFESFDDLLINLQNNNPVIVSISFKDGELEGAPLPTAGHLVVVTGADKKYVYVNDPAAPETETVNRKYRRTQFVKAWKGVAYIGIKLMMLFCFLSLNPLYSAEEFDLDISEEAVVNTAKGSYFLIEKEYEKAIEEFKKVYDENKSNHEILYLIGMTFLESGKLDEAKAFISKAFVLAPRELKYGYVFGLGLVDYYKKDYQKAYKKFILVTKKEPQSGEAFFYLGKILVTEQKTEEATDNYLKASCLVNNPKIKAELDEEMLKMNIKKPDCKSIVSEMNTEEEQEEKGGFTIQSNVGLFYDSNVTLNSKDGSSLSSDVDSISIPLFLVFAYELAGKWNWVFSSNFKGNFYTKKAAIDYQTFSGALDVSTLYNFSPDIKFEFSYVLDETWLNTNHKLLPYIMGNNFMTGLIKKFKSSNLEIFIPLGYDKYQISNEKSGVNLGFGTTYTYNFEKLGSLIGGILAIHSNANDADQKNFLSSASINYLSPVFYDFVDSSLGYTLAYYNYYKADPKRYDKDNTISFAVNFYPLISLKVSAEYIYKDVTSNYSTYSYVKQIVGLRITYVY